jgi:tetratricopeptide (TPR) repeat protein
MWKAPSLARLGAAAFALAIAAAAWPGTARGQSVDAEVDYNAGLAAARDGREADAYAAFKRACLAERGHAGACLAWAGLAAKRSTSDPDRDKDVKRALGSAVMLDPESVEARYDLGLVLLEKQDWTWAIEHLEAGLAGARDPADKALFGYYLGYARFKSGALDDADRAFAQAEGDLPKDLAQLCSFYRGIIAERQKKVDKAAAMFDAAEAGPDPAVSDAVARRRAAATAFPRADGVRGQLMASIGMNTHPTAAVFDDPGQAGAPVLESVLRGDLSFASGSYTHGFLGAATLYREQSWTEIGPSASAASDEHLYVANNVSPSDTNVTDFQAQLSYLWRGFGARLEHEVRLGLDTELQFLDHDIGFEQPAAGADGAIDPCLAGSYESSTDTFNLYAYSIGGRLWWSFAESKRATWSLQLKYEHRPNELEPDRSANRFRLRAQHQRWFLDRALQLKAYAGLRYDRTYHDADIVKYDKVQSEASFELKWSTPLPYLGVLVGGKLLYHWYLNSSGNKDNSFRPPFTPNDDFSADENAAFERDYYDLARRDFEWELSAELQLDLWKSAVLAVRYLHHQRTSNIDAAPRPMVPVDGCGEPYQRIPAQPFGYTQDLAVLELRQSF